MAVTARTVATAASHAHARAIVALAVVRLAVLAGGDAVLAVAVLAS